MRGDRARQRLAGTRFGDIRWVAETGSTNRDLLELAEGGEPEGVVVVADHQRAGRGRLDRSWHAPPGGSLLVSVLMRPTLAVSDAHVLTTAMALGAAEACETIAGVSPRMKWPNDLVIEPDSDPDDAAALIPRKLGGILAESILDGRRLDAVVVGMGLNVNWPAELPDELAGIAVALNHVSGHEIDREDLLVALLEGLDHWYGRVQAGDAGRAEVAERARALSVTLGAEVRVDLGTEVVEGRADDLTAAGELVVVTASGQRRTIVAGDVVHLRPDR